MAGHIRKRTNKSGKTVYQARYPDPHRGGTRKIEKTFRTKREAEDWLTQQHSAVLTGTHLDPRKLDTPFRELIDTWKASWVDLSPTTMAGYTTALDTHLLPRFGRHKVGAITHDAVQQYINELVQADKLRAGSIRQIYSVLRNAMSAGVRLGLVQVNPCTKIRLPKQSQQEMLFLDAAEARALAEAITPRYRVLVYTAAYTGMRAGEIHALRRRDIDLERGTISVRRSFRLVQGTIHIGDTKTVRSRRTITLPRFLREMLAEHLNARAADGAAEPDDLVFVTRRGNPIRQNLFYYRHYKKAVKAAMPPEKQGLRFHDLRHTFASLLIAQGANPKAISTMLGHSTVQLTFDRYGHMLPAVEAALADALDATFATA